jgi:hypothetical protein
MEDEYVADATGDLEYAEEEGADDAAPVARQPLLETDKQHARDFAEHLPTTYVDPDSFGQLMERLLVSPNRINVLWRAGDISVPCAPYLTRGRNNFVRLLHPKWDALRNTARVYTARFTQNILDPDKTHRSVFYTAVHASTNAQHDRLRRWFLLFLRILTRRYPGIASGRPHDKEHISFVNWYKRIDPLTAVGNQNREYTALVDAIADEAIAKDAEDIEPADIGPDLERLGIVRTPHVEQVMWDLYRASTPEIQECVDLAREIDEEAANRTPAQCYQVSERTDVV